MPDAILDAAELLAKHAVGQYYGNFSEATPLHAASVVLPVLLADLEEHRPDCGGRVGRRALGRRSGIGRR
jgi:hypothetical protein